MTWQPALLSQPSPVSAFPLRDHPGHEKATQWLTWAVVRATPDGCKVCFKKDSLVVRVTGRLWRSPATFWSLIYNKKVTGRYSQNPVVWCDGGCQKDQQPDYSETLQAFQRRRALLKNMKEVNRVGPQQFMKKIAQVQHLEDCVMSWVEAGGSLTWG